MTRTSTGHDLQPIYEDLVRELGDAVAEAQSAAAHTEQQATELLGFTGPRPAHRHPQDATAASGRRQEGRGHQP
ncbi:hypothetical protein DN402_04480 [Streptomyces sp. SW4]|nr:hypothetical protein DN402_04480 [Streptomyces sp. SW4]